MKTYEEEGQEVMTADVIRKFNAMSDSRKRKKNYLNSRHPKATGYQLSFQFTERK